MSLRDWLTAIFILGAASLAPIEVKAANRTVVINADGSGTVGRNTRFPTGYFPTNTIQAGSSMPIRGEAMVMGVQGGAGGPIINGNHQVAYKDPHGRVSVVPINHKVKVPKAAIAAAGRIAMRTIPWVAGLAALADELNIADIYPGGEQGEWLKQEEEESPAQYADIWTPEVIYGPSPSNECLRSRLTGAGTLNRSAIEAHFDYCAPVNGAYGTAGPNRKWTTPVIWTKSGNTATATRDGCNMANECGASVARLQTSFQETLFCESPKTLVGEECIETVERSATDSELEAAINSAPDSDQPALLNSLADDGIPISIPPSAGSEVTIPSPSFSSPPVSKTRTYTDSQGNSHTETRVTTYEGDVTTNATNISTNTTSNTTVTTTVTTITNVYVDGNPVPVETIEEDVPLPLPPPPDPEPLPEEEQPEEEITFEDSDFPEIPELYEQKYPDGIVGVWNEKKPALMNTSIISGVTGMFPSIGSGGTCPSWTLNLNFGGPMNMGTHELKVECWIWEVCGLIFMASACFVSWRILFGRGY